MKTENDLNSEVIVECMSGVRPKPLEWVDHGTDDYRVFQALTEFGSFAYGTDINRQPYYQTPDSEQDTQTEEAAKIAAEDDYAWRVFQKVATYVVPKPKQSAPSPEIVAELQMLLANYADGCAEARNWGGPTMCPQNPITEDVARRFAKLLVVEA
jgi:hypothetical protein